TDPLLRRPFSIFSIKNDTIEILYKVVGKGTLLLSRRSKGEKLDILAPLGNGFSIPQDGGDFILVAGGMGIAPLYALAEKLSRAGKGKVALVIGACNKNHILAENDFKELGIKVIVATEDGSKGCNGKVTDVLKGRRFTASITSSVTVFSCGPYPMLKAVSGWAEKHGFPCQVSLEPHMGCGIGACLSCVVKLKADNGFKNVCACKEGPVFRSDEIVWE
ncbi:MAG: dihydroorotate dehydrogenase electron transfer subunit, partial [Candidatus Omnitrophica bacterium]|nr:dihydroorotate dehydrogenase electron transfer subunit [Candidatus Omnitrophota bacterium]